MIDMYEELEGKNHRPQNEFDSSFHHGDAAFWFWNYNGKWYLGNDLNYGAQGMYDAAHGRPYFLSSAIPYGWKLIKYGHFPSSEAMGAYKGGHYLYGKLERLQATGEYEAYVEKIKDRARRRDVTNKGETGWTTKTKIR